MQSAIREGLDLTQSLAALPFKAARQLLQGSALSGRPLGSVLDESLHLGEGLARLPFKALAAVMEPVQEGRPNLEQRIAALEQRVGQVPPPEKPPGAQS